MQALRLPAARGWQWIVEGLRLYRRNPALLTLLALNYWLFFLLIFILPLLGPFAANIALQALSVTVMNGCRAIDQERKVALDIVWSGFKRNLPALLKLGALYMTCELAVAGILVLAYGASFLDALDPAKAAGEADAEQNALASFLYTALLLTLPIVLSFWFAPMLVAWNDLGALKALFFSVVAVLRNWRAFAIYGAGAMLLSAVLPLMVRALAGGESEVLLTAASMVLTMALVFLVMPILFASVYVSYREVFAAEAGDAAAA